MNQNLQKLQTYPFQQLRLLLGDILPPAHKVHINLSLGEPRHPIPEIIKKALVDAVDGLAFYPIISGSDVLRNACAAWVLKRYGINLDPLTEILPVNGSREALFSFTQTVIDTSTKPIVICPNPYYPIYPGAAYLSGAQPYFVNCLAENRFQPNWDSVPDNIWSRTQLVFICNPSNPTGGVMSEDDWKKLFYLAEKYKFIIASDECYSEIYFGFPPMGSLEAAKNLGFDYKNIMMFTSLSKRSNVPGLRSGFVAGGKAIMDKFRAYRTFHGCAMSPVAQAASTVAWQDEQHVVENRIEYVEKFNIVISILAEVMEVIRPDAGFFLWLKIPGGNDLIFTRQLFESEHITVLPGSLIAGEANGINPGAGYIRVALVATKEECIEAAHRIRRFIHD